MKRIAVDLDGVLAQYQGAAHSDLKGGSEIGDPVPGAVEFVLAAGAAGWQVVVHSRNHHPAAVNGWLLKNGLGDCVATSVLAPDATVYLDDRAVRFDGDFGPALAFLQGDPRPWWRKAGAVAGGGPEA